MDAVDVSQMLVPVLEVQFSCILQLSSDVANIRDREAFGIYFPSFSHATPHENCCGNSCFAWKYVFNQPWLCLILFNCFNNHPSNTLNLKMFSVYSKSYKQSLQSPSQCSCKAKPQSFFSLLYNSTAMILSDQWHMLLQLTYHFSPFFKWNKPVERADFVLRLKSMFALMSYIS